MFDTPTNNGKIWRNHPPVPITPQKDYAEQLTEKVETLSGWKYALTWFVVILGYCGVAALMTLGVIALVEWVK